MNLLDVIELLKECTTDTQTMAQRKLRDRRIEDAVEYLELVRQIFKTPLRTP